MRKLFVLTITILIVVQLQAQKSFQKNTFYIEVMGNGLVLSTNYERQVNNKPGFGMHAGIGLGGDKPAFPFGIKYLLPLDKQKSFFEVGAGVTIAEQDLWSETNFSQSKQNSYSAGFIPSIGYRHHTSYGLMWRVNYTPVFNNNRTELLFFGGSIGWRI